MVYYIALHSESYLGIISANTNKESLHELVCYIALNSETYLDIISAITNKRSLHQMVCYIALCSETYLCIISATDATNKRSLEVILLEGILMDKAESVEFILNVGQLDLTVAFFTKETVKTIYHRVRSYPSHSCRNTLSTK